MKPMRRKPKSEQLPFQDLTVERAAWRGDNHNGVFRWHRSYDQATGLLTYTFTWLMATSMVVAKLPLPCQDPGKKDARRLAVQLRAARKEFAQALASDRVFTEGSLFQRTPPGVLTWLKAW